jgi:hypothetical protein
MPGRFEIDVFRDLPETVEIIGLGRICPPSGQAVEMEIEVYLASSLRKREFDPAIHVHRRQVSCGQMDLLVVGSRWKKGRPLDVAEDVRCSANFAFYNHETVGAGAASERSRSPCYPSTRFADAPGLLLRRTNWDATPEGEPNVVLLPQVELIRAMFGVSSRFLIELIDGLRDPRVADRGLLDRDSGRTLSLPDGTVRLVCWRKPTEEEALILAAMVSEPKMMSLHDEVFQQLSVSKDMRAEKPTWLKVTWPFGKKPFHLAFAGRWFEREDGRRRFIVTRISAFGLNLSFGRIEVRYPGSEGGTSGDPLPPGEGRTRPGNARVPNLTKGRPPSWARRQLEILSPPVDMPTAEPIVIDYVPSGDIRRPRQSTLGEDPRERGDFSTAGREEGGDPRVGRGNVRRGRIDPEEAAAARADALNKTWKAIVRAAATAGWGCTPHPTGPGPTHGRGPFDFFAEGILASLNVGGRHVVVTDEGSSEGDRRSLGILVPRIGKRVTGADLAEIRMVGAEFAGRWGTGWLEIEGFEISAVRRHPTVWEKPEEYAALLRARISEAVGASVDGVG